MSSIPDEIAAFVSRELEARANPTKAASMAGYMKTDMPFYGVYKPGREEIAALVAERFVITTRRDYESTVKTLWTLPHREEKYFAITVARLYANFITPQSLPLYKKLIREGAWWDFVDEVATQLVGTMLREHRTALSSQMDAWIDAEDRWVRRSGLLCQIRHKRETDERRLFAYCRKCAHETEFFIRKAIGWALRDYSYTAPERVVEFLQDNKDRLSGLSFREGAKVLRRKGYPI